MIYKRLGDYIKPVNNRNKELEVTTLLGVSIKKVLMPSIANTIGTNMKTYKIIERNQFAYGPVTSRNGDKISIALLEDFEKAIVSQAYTVFKVIDEKEVLPEYLMMWFRRPEFDRFARFKSHGSAREIFDWDELCDTQLPIPSIEKQQQIVNEYNTVTNRIQLNQKINTNLEATAQALYKHWFVDFEFPITEESCPELASGSPHLIGKPYKSSGGKMVYNEELDKDIPVGWLTQSIGELSVMSQGIQVDVDLQYKLRFSERMNRFVRIIDYTPDTNEQPRYVEIEDKKYFVDKTDVVMIRYGDAGTVCRRIEGIIANNLFKINPIKIVTKNFLYYFLKEKETQRLIKNSDLAVAMPAITHSTIKALTVSLPSYPDYLISVFDEYSQDIENEILIRIKENSNLKVLRDVLLSKMTQVAPKPQAI